MDRRSAVHITPPRYVSVCYAKCRLRGRHFFPLPASSSFCIHPALALYPQLCRTGWYRVKTSSDNYDAVFDDSARARYSVGMIQFSLSIGAQGGEIVRSNLGCDVDSKTDRFWTGSAVNVQTFLHKNLDAGSEDLAMA